MTQRTLSRRSLLSLAGALLFVGVLVGVYVAHSLHQSQHQAQDDMLAGLAKAFRPEVDVRSTVMTSLGELHKHSKWVVLSADIDVVVTKESHKTILWNLLDLGTTTVSVEVPGNRAQYVMNLQEVVPEAFAVEGSVLVVTLPSPKVDEELVEVQSDPSRLRVRTDVGWARLKSRSGEQLRQQALSEIRARVVEQAQAEPLMFQAQAQARQEVTKLLAVLVERLQPGMHLEVRFDSVFVE